MIGVIADNVMFYDSQEIRKYNNLVARMEEAIEWGRKVNVDSPSTTSNQNQIKEYKK